MASLRKFLHVRHTSSSTPLFPAMKLTPLALTLSGFVLSAMSSNPTGVLAAEGTTSMHEAKSWGYKENDESMFGPAQWGAQYPTCAGSHQSPIDLPRYQKRSGAKSPLAFSGECDAYKLTHTEEAYKAFTQGGSCAVSVNSAAKYSMLQLHMHAPAEHMLSGQAFDGEAHFVHQSTDGKLLVVGLFLKKQENAQTDPWLTKFWDSLDNVNTTTTESEIKLYVPYQHCRCLEAKLVL